jgi:hypothetical protein
VFSDLFIIVFTHIIACLGSKKWFCKWYLMNLPLLWWLLSASESSTFKLFSLQRFKKLIFLSFQTIKFHLTLQFSIFNYTLNIKSKGFRSLLFTWSWIKDYVTFILMNMEILKLLKIELCPIMFLRKVSLFKF